MTSGDIKRSLYRAVRRYASEQSTSLWRGREVRADWSEQNLAAVTRLGEHILNLDDDDPRFAGVANAYAGQAWRLQDPSPWEPLLGGWLPHLGTTGDSGVPQKPDEFVSAWASAASHHAQ